MQVVKQTDIQVNKLMSLVQLKAVTGLSRSTIYELINSKSDYSKFSETYPFDSKSDWLVVTGNQRLAGVKNRSMRGVRGK